MRVRWMILVLATAVLGFLGTAWGQWDRDTLKLFEAVGESAGSRLGVSVAGIGDQNGDGYDDIIAGASGDRKVYLYYGGSPMDAVPDMVFRGIGGDEIVGRLSYAGDVNGDGAGDFMAQVQYNNWEIAKIYIYFGGSLLDTLPDVILVGDEEEGIGSPFSGAGDVNGDGYDDVIASADWYENYRGKVYIFFGGPDMDSIPDWTVVGDTAYSYFGEYVTGGGDLNGDGYDDVVISGVRGWLPVPIPYMYLRGYYGGQEMDTIPDFELGWTEAASIVGDVNGDGYADIVSRAVDTTQHPLGSWGEAAAAIEETADTCHGAYIFYGGQQMDTIPDVCLRSGIPWLYGPGWPYSAAGDVNRDGYADVISGNKDGFGGFGCVLIYLGGRNMDGKLDVGFQGLYYSSYPGCGDAVGRAGDVNGDGIDDILFGATGLSWPDEYSEGKVLVFSGDTSWSYVREERRGVGLPREVELGQNWPNPFNSATTIRYTLPQVIGERFKMKGGPNTYNLIPITLKVYNILGQEVRTLVDKPQKGGRYEVSWDGKDNQGKEVSSGVYLCRLKVIGDRCKVVKTRKMVLLR